MTTFTHNRLEAISAPPGHTSPALNRSTSVALTSHPALLIDGSVVSRPTPMQAIQDFLLSRSPLHQLKIDSQP